MRIRKAATTDYPRLQEIERSAGEMFRAVGMAAIADDEPFSDAELDEYRRAGRAWVAAGEDDVAMGYLVADLVDGNLHIEQVSVDPRHARRGVGRLLIDHAAALGWPALTLTTFADVPWNAPYYRRLGFVVVDDPEPELEAVRKREAAHGLDRWPRVCMRRAPAGSSYPGP